MEQGNFVSGHVYYSPDYADMLKRNNIKHVFLTRDLRDIVVSYTYFISGPYLYHPLREHMLQLGSRKEQFLALIQGVRTETVQYPDIGSWYQQFHGWSNHEDVCRLTFEQLMTSKATRRKALERLLRFLSGNILARQSLRAVLNAMESRIDPSNSLTFRKGVSGEWKHEFDDEVKQIVKQTAGKWLIADGYEKNNDW
ncbi:sulfotransferase domain-containing protein [Paenibacillus sp. BR2-3]|uniref:sulfotransferase domain-containing protein n=1 Tax=Paenibacillus sp. BR2-3 TaxID=3048494 RepID=UPI00397780B3